MQLPVQITFKDMAPSEAVAARIREKAAKLERFHDHITSCRVVVEMLGQHHHQGNLFKVHIDITVPGSEIVVSRDSQLDHGHEDVYVAIRDAFSAARRQLENHMRRIKYKVKRHAVPPHGRVVEHFQGRGYGTIRTSDGRDIYFHENSVLNGGFAQLQVGTDVRFVEGQGDAGPQASSVRPVGRHHIVARKGWSRPA